MTLLRNLRYLSNSRVSTWFMNFLQRNSRSTAAIHGNQVSLYVDDFGYIDNRKVKKYTWETSNGLSLSAITYGAIVQSIKYPDKSGTKKDVLLGFDTLEDYQYKNTPYFGAVVGRVIQRITSGSFELDGLKYVLTHSFLGSPHLRRDGFHKVVWDDVVIGKKVILSYLSKDWEESYPGNVLTNISYEVTADGCFNVDFLATTSKKTPVNLTQHLYMNLAGHDAGSVQLYNHHVTINADKVTETGRTGVPTGRFIPVANTPRDLRIETRIGDIGLLGNLIDDNYCVNDGQEDEKLLVASIRHPTSGRALKVYSDQPIIQFHTGNLLPPHSEKAIVGKDFARYSRHAGFYLNTKKYADIMHNSQLLNVILVPGHAYKHKSVYKFVTET